MVDFVNVLREEAIDENFCLPGQSLDESWICIDAGAKIPSVSLHNTRYTRETRI